MPNVVDLQCFAGGFSLGAVQAGFEMTHKLENGTFGVAVAEVNSHLFGTPKIETRVSNWPALPNVDLVLSNPPCSQFSYQTEPRHKLGRPDAFTGGIELSFDFIARNKPKIAVVECVATAPAIAYFSQAGKLFPDATVTLLRHNNMDFGGTQFRPRLFTVISRVPFGITVPEKRRPPSLAEMLEPVEDVPVGAVPGHYTTPERLVTWQMLKAVHDAVGEWPPGADYRQMLQRCYAKHGELPEVIKGRDTIIATNFAKGYFRSTGKRLTWDTHDVVTGGCVLEKIHPGEFRLMTHLEAALLMGWPANMNFPATGELKHGRVWGKAVCTQNGKWIAEQAAACLDGRPGPVTGQQIGDNVYIINGLNKWKRDGS